MNMNGFVRNEVFFMRDYKSEFEKRVKFIKSVIAESGAKGIVYGNSGGKDSALVGILCKAACDNTIGLILPCTSKRNYNEDTDDAKAVAAKYNIETRIIDLDSVKEAELKVLADAVIMNEMALANIAPRLRMLTLYAIAAAENCLVAGTGNKSETYVGYFTKWGDGACDFNPIADLTVTEIYEFLRFLNAPKCVIEKAPSAALFDGQTDEREMGITYAEIDCYISGEKVAPETKKIIEHMHRTSAHKRNGVTVYTQ